MSAACISADETVSGSRRARDEWLERALRERFSAEELATEIRAGHVRPVRVDD